MKKILGSVALLMTAGMISCSEDFDVAAPYKEVTVAYGLLNMDDTAHYIRIQKAFMDESRSALDMAKVPDSSFLSSLDVRVKEINFNNQVIGEIELSRVNLIDEGHPKEDGTFFNSPHFAYKFKHQLNPSNKYRLVIKNTETGKVDSAETVVISSNPNEDPSDFQVIEFRRSEYSLNFVNAGRPNGVFNINIKSPANARLYEGVLRFHWVDRNINTLEEKRYSADWVFGTTESVSAGFSLSVEQSKFIPFLINSMKPAPDNIDRYIDSADLFVWAATEDVYTYQQYQRATGGLTGDQVKPNYSNFKGDDVLGLFASRATKYKLQIPFNAVTLDTLMMHPDARPLKIRGVTTN